MPAEGQVRRDPAKRKQAQAGGGRAASRQKQTSGIDSQVKLTLFIVFTVGIICLIVVIISVMGPAKSYAEQACEDVKSETGTLFEANICALKDCKFDISLCKLPCPFGYEVDPLGCAMSCECASRGEFEVDVHFESSDLPMLLEAYVSPKNETIAVYGVGTNKEHRKWYRLPSGRIEVPYKFLRMPPSTVELFHKSAEWMAKHTCIDFLPLNERKEKAHIIILQSNGCWSQLGKTGLDGPRGGKEQQLSLGIDCYVLTVVIHECIHAIGFYHEQSRPDRENHITLNYDNVKEGFLNNFQIKTDTDDLGFEYDIDSIMHYASNNFAKSGKMTFVKKSDGEAYFHPRPHYPTETDLAEINKYYECDKAPGADMSGSWGPWGKFGECTGFCGPSTKYKFRHCLNKAGEFAFGCTGDATLVDDCDNGPCPGVYLPWGPWSPCSTSCNADGTKVRSRLCDPPQSCPGHHRAFYVESTSCNFGACATLEGYDKTAKWTEWTRFDGCPEVCEKKLKTKRQRYCVDTFHFKSQDCPRGEFSEVVNGVQFHYKSCDCDIESESRWTQWKEWSGCSASCEGTRTRERTCPMHYHDDCLAGEAEETEDCGKRSCTEVESTGIFGPTVKVGVMCAYGSLHSGKFNNDDQEDIMCYYGDGYIRLYFASADGKIGDLSWQGKTVFCNMMDTDVVITKHVGDLNGDGLDDLLCHNRRSGRMEVVLNKGGKFSNSLDWKGRRQTCRGTIDKVRVVDMNGDKRVDFICGTHRVALKKILLNKYE